MWLCGLGVLEFWVFGVLGALGLGVLGFWGQVAGLWRRAVALLASMAARRERIRRLLHRALDL